MNDKFEINDDGKTAKEKYKDTNLESTSMIALQNLDQWNFHDENDASQGVITGSPLP
ncbi:12791_t:CDS:2 [Funneliformis geosporum]|uniref:12791_t:CDS:1 n=1 Tax=Funneliformis geosporum TaxID=1117311 RepID=A0A9W4WQ48_9GLOM|nr:12791_t:CDS:2 [Funneliformis geosporum]